MSPPTTAAADAILLDDWTEQAEARAAQVGASLLGDMRRAAHALGAADAQDCAEAALLALLPLTAAGAQKELRDQRHTERVRCVARVLQQVPRCHRAEALASEEEVQAWIASM